MSSIQKHAGSRGASPVGGMGGETPPKKIDFENFRILVKSKMHL